MLTASIVTYHTPYAELSRIADCVLRGGVERLYVVDNSRHDALRRCETLSPRIRYIHNANTGYGSGHNIALREAMELGADYHVVVNPDICFGAGTLEALTAYMDAHPDTGWVMPRVTYPDGQTQYLCKLLPSPLDLFFRRFLPGSWFRQRRARFELRHTGYDREMNVPFLSGCFMFLRVSALREVGLFDERFFMYGEDIDLSRRMHRRYKTAYYPGVSIVHAHAAASYKSRKMLGVHLHNITRYFNKHGWIFDRERRRLNRACMQREKK